MQTITIRFERPDETEYNPLSPGTRYIGSFDNQRNNTVTIGFDQAAFAQQKEMLRYFNGVTEEQRREALDFFGVHMKHFLDAIQLLRVEFGNGAEALHLRLLVGARELVQLPFELTRNLEGIAGELMIPLLLNQTRVVTMTRAVRELGHFTFEWPAVPRILFAAASPESSVPFKEHFEALRDVVKELVGPDKTSPEPIPEIGEKLSFIQNASLQSIRQKIAEGIVEKTLYARPYPGSWRPG